MCIRDRLYALLHEVLRLMLEIAAMSCFDFISLVLLHAIFILNLEMKKNEQYKKL